MLASSPELLQARYHFYCRTQTPLESIEDFYQDINQLSLKCDFKDRDEHVRDKLLHGIRDEGIRQECFKVQSANEQNPKLEAILRVCRAEQSQRFTENRLYHQQNHSQFIVNTNVNINILNIVLPKVFRFLQRLFRAIFEGSESMNYKK